MSRARDFQLDDHVRLRREHHDYRGDEVAVIARTWHDEEGLPPPPDHDDDPMNRNLEEGEYGIGLVPSRRRIIVRAEDLELIDRTFALGQLCKLQAQDGPMSGVITKVERHVEVEHVLSRQRIPERIPAGEVRPSSCIQNGDHVAYGNWIGIVMDTFIEGALKIPDLPHKFRFGRILDQPFQLGPMQDLGAAVPALTMHSGEEACLVDLRETVVYIDWLAINPKLTSAEQERFPKPKSFWTELEELTSLRQEYNRLYVINDVVNFKTPELRERYGLRPVDIGPDMEPLDAMRIIATHSHVHVCWQDGTQTEHESNELRLYNELTENDAYRGEHVMYRDKDGQERGAIVFAIDPVERIAEVVPYDSTDESPVTMSVLDLKTGGAPGLQSTLPRGHVVLIAPHLNAYAPPQVSVIGSLEPLNDLTDHEIDTTLQSMGERIKNETRASVPSQRRPRLAADAIEIDWYGIVVDLMMDGKAIIRFPSRHEATESLENLAILQDGFLDAEDHFHDLHSEDSDMHLDDAPWMTEDGAAVEEADWEDFSERDRNGVHDIVLDDEDLNLTGASAVSDQDAQTASASIPTDTETDVAECKIFEVLEVAPLDHAYHSQSSRSGAPPKKFLSRLQREYKMLQSALPADILVRAYEDRTDLLRALIIGSQGTPYEDAPVCIDIQLKPTYPEEAPLAYFHSWTQGHGRLSPNLYEDGNICLSVLGTWTGEASESWNPAQSTLLQVLVSIQGLVLVAEPYYTEPGFERQRETEAGRTNSRHYSERAYVQARRAVLHALSHPVKSFEAELRRIYHHESRLQSIIDRASLLVDGALQPNEDGNNSFNALPDAAWGCGGRITKGTALALKRIVEDLRNVKK